MSPTATLPAECNPPEAVDAEQPLLPKPTRAQIDHCAFSSWYPKFMHCSLRSRIIRPLPEDFVAYLDADSVFVPANTIRSNDSTDYDAYSSDHETDSESDSSENNEPNFPDLEAQICTNIDELGGAVFPKLNWSSPKDATWIAFSASLKCTTPADIFLLLKSSDFVAHDLEHAYDDCRGSDNAPFPKRPDEIELVLREWFDLSPSMEFRCFVRNNKLRCISQRDVANYYEFLVHNRDDIRAKMIEFYVDHIASEFPDADYVFDAYMNARTRKVWLIDFNPCAPSTDTLLFSWTEILSDRPDEHSKTDMDCEFRIVVSAAEAHGSNQPAYALNRLPREAFEFSDGATIAEFANRLNQEIFNAQIESDA